MTLLALLVGFEHFVPRVPAPLVAIAVAIAASGLLWLYAMGVATVGHVAGGLPTLMPPQVELAQAMHEITRSAGVPWAAVVGHAETGDPGITVIE